MPKNSLQFKNMPLPHLVIAGQKAAVFKHFNYYYGPLINTTPAGSYPVKQNITVHDEMMSFTWPSSEQAYHAQKIIHLKTKLAKNNPMQQQYGYTIMLTLN